MTGRNKLFIAAALVLAAGGVVAGTAAGGQTPQRPTATVHAQWDFHPTSMAQAQSRADQIVLAEVVSVRAGADIVTAQAGEPDGVDRIPTQRVTVRVLKSYKGTAQAGQQLTLFQTGGVVSTAKAGDSHPRLVLDGDPFYVKGEQYVLMLVAGPQDTLRIVAPEGRFRTDRSGQLTAMVSGPVADQVSGLNLAQLEAVLAG